MFTKFYNPRVNLLAFSFWVLSLLSGKLNIFLKAITTSPALLINNLFKKFLWISIILRFCLNFWITYLMALVLELFKRPFKTLKVFFFCSSVIFCWIFNKVLFSLHFLNAPPTPSCILAKMMFNAFSFISFSLLFLHQMSLFPFMTRFRVLNTFVTCLH